MRATRGYATLGILALMSLAAACAPKVVGSSGSTFGGTAVDVRVTGFDVQSDPSQPSFLSVTATATHDSAILDVEVRIFLAEPGSPLQPVETLDATEASLVAGGSITRSVRTDTAASTPGSYVLACSVVPKPPLTDSDLANNVASWASPLTIGGPARPDLRNNGGVTSVVSPTSLAGPGSALQLNGSVLNDGPGNSGSFRIGVYASIDATVTTADILLGHVDMLPLASFASANFQATVSTGSLLPSSVYQIGWIADPDGVITEVSENNNAQLAANGPVVLGSVLRPDLDTNADGASLSTYNLPNPGSPLSATCIVRNLGNAATGTYSVAFYASIDVTITTSDLLLGTTTASSLAPGTSGNVTLSNASTSSLLAGQSYQVGWIVDPANVIVEHSEANNNASLPNQLAVAAPTGFPDLSTQSLNSSFTPTTIASPGLPISVACEVQNLGAATSPATTVNFYASVDSTISTSDPLLGTRPLGAMAAGTTTTCTLSSGATASLTAGQAYHIGWIVDPSGTVTESNESNNRASAGGQLVVGSVVPTLVNGVAVPFTVSADGTLPYRISLPTGTQQMVVEITGSGDADLYVKRLPIVWPNDQGPHNETEFKAPYITGSNESVTFLNPASGQWNVLLHGYPSFATSSGTIRSTWSQGFAVRLDGLSGYGSASGVGGVVGNSTWEAWVRLPSYQAGNAGFRNVLFRWGMYSHAAPIVNPSTGAVGAGGASCPNGAETTTSHLLPGVWHHVAAQYAAQPGPIVVYVDGVEVARNNTGVTCSPYLGWTTLLGASGNTGITGFLRADIDEARISNVLRYSGPFTPQRRFTPDANTLSLWHFDEGSGTTVQDQSGNNRHLTLYGGVSWVPGN